MSGRADYTREEWALLARAPFLIGMLMTQVSPSGITGVLEESQAVSQAVLRTHGLPLIRELLGDIQASEGNLAQPEQRITQENALGHALNSLRQVNHLLTQKASEEEAAAFKNWLVEIAYDTASAAKEGGVWGIGGQQVNQAELEALNQIRSLLGYGKSLG